MQTSNTYSLDEFTGRIVHYNPLGERLLPVIIAGTLHLCLFAALLLGDISNGELTLPDEGNQEIAFMVETYVEEIPEPVYEEEVIEDTPPLEEEIEEIIEEDPPVELNEPEPEPLAEPEVKPEVIEPKPRLKVKAPQPKPEPKPKPVSKPVLAKPPAKVMAAPVMAQPRMRATNQLGLVKPVYPAYLRNPAPAYPKSAKKRRQEGIVELKVKVGLEGNVLELSLYKSSNINSLDSAALNTVRNWRFLPARKNGKTVVGEVIVPIRFQLKYN